MTFQESETIELKEIVVEDIKKEIIAFANSAGGTLYVGVADDGSIVGVDSSDTVTQQISNMVRDSIKPDVTMFVRYDTKVVDGKQIVTVEIQRGTERPYYLAKKGLRPEGVYVRQGTSSVPATTTAIRRMIKDTDGDSFEAMRSLEQNLTFQAAAKEFEARNIAFGVPQMQTLGLLSTDGIYTNLGLLLSEQCTHTVKAAVFERHVHTGHKGLGFVGGYGLKKGAVATSVAHDSHNLIVVGTNDWDMVLAANAVRKNGGGLAVAAEGRVLGELALPIGGVMSRLSVQEVEERLQALKSCTRELGISSDIDAFMTLAFVSLPVIPKLRINTYGVIDVDRQKQVPPPF